MESYAYSLKNTLGEEQFKSKLDASEIEEVTKAADETISWLDANQTATQEEFADQQKELESKANPIMTKAYQAGATPSGAAGAAQVVSQVVLPQNHLTMVQLLKKLIKCINNVYIY